MKAKLQRMQVPMVSVDFLEEDPRWDISAKNKFTLLSYVALDREIENLGNQRFSASTIDSIFFEPVRAWVSKHWASEFTYDFSERTIPITFRAALAMGLFSAKIRDYLNNIGAIDLYCSEQVQEVFKNNGLPVPEGLTQVDYASLAPEIQKELVFPVVSQLQQAGIIAKARSLFPEGVDYRAVALSDTNRLFSMVLDGMYGEKIINFDTAEDLERRARVAGTCIDNYLRIKQIGQRIDERKDASPKDSRTTEDLSKSFEENILATGDYVKCEYCDKLERKAEFEPGTTFFDIFPMREGETKDDVLRAYLRISEKGLFGCTGLEDYHEDLKLHLREDGQLRGYYHYDYFGDDSKDTDFDMIAEGNDTYSEHLRRTNLWGLADALREDMDLNSDAVETARSLYGQTSFVVEKGFLEAVTSRNFDEREISEDEARELLNLAREAKKTAGMPAEPAEEPTNLARYSNGPVDRETLILDYKILSAIRDEYRLRSAAEILGAFFSKEEPDRIGDWIKATASGLARFRSVMVDTASLFHDLEISPTNSPGEKEIKRAFRNIARKYHPDTTVNLLPEQQLETAEKYLKAEQAYQNLMSRAGTIISGPGPTAYLGRISYFFENSIKE